MAATGIAREATRIEDPDVFAGVPYVSGAAFDRVFECEHGDWAEVGQENIMVIDESGAETRIGRFPLRQASGIRTAIDRWCKAHPVDLRGGQEDG